MNPMEITVRAENLQFKNFANNGGTKPRPCSDPNQKPKILIVDDENGPRQSLRVLLNENHNVELASDVSTALDILEHDPVNLVITDIRMPRQSGVELLQAVKKNYPETQVILLTGYAHLQTAMEAVEYGAFAYVEKPFDKTVMLKRVADALDRYRQEHDRRVLEKLAIEANRFETLGRFISGMIHDMGTPLSVVGSQIEMIMNNPERGDVPDRMKTMQSQVRHCSELVRSAMNFLRCDASPLTPFYINNIIETCLEVAHPILRSQNVRVERALGLDMPSSIGDVVLVRQAILNLIVNACHAMHKQAAPQQLLIETWCDRGHVYLAIEDSGPGIPIEMREKIFDTFFTTKGKAGTGLGLAVVKNVMDRHNGSVEVICEAGKGARFVLRFPVAGREELLALFNANGRQC